jgi:hypothetical protein
MAVAKFVINITNRVNSGTMSGASLNKLIELKNSAQSSCMADTKFLTDALKAYKQITHLLNSTSCTFHLSTFDFAGRVAAGDFVNDTLMEQFGTNPDKALSDAVMLINSACSSINGLMGFINMLKDFLLALYRLMDFLRGLGDLGLECNFGELELLLGQTNKPTPGVFTFPASIQAHYDASAVIFGKLYGNRSSGIPSILSYNEVQLTREPLLAEDTVNGVAITQEMILKDSLVHPNSLSYDPDIGLMYDKGVRYGQSIVDMQSRLANGLIMDAGDIATHELATAGSCSIDGYLDKASCEQAGGVWTVLSDLAKTKNKIPRTLQISDLSELFDTTIEPKDNVLNTTTGIIYIRTYEPLPDTSGSLSIQGVKGSVPPYHYTLSIQSKLIDSSYISLQSISDLEQKLVSVTNDYQAFMVKKSLASTKLANAISNAADIGTSTSVLQGYNDLMNSYDLRADNLKAKFDIVNNTVNKIGRLKWLIDLGNQAKDAGKTFATLNDGINGPITLNFPIKSFDTSPGAFNDPTNSNEFISTDITNPNSYLNHIQQFYDESKKLEDFIDDMNTATRDLILVYNDFRSKNALSDQIYYGVHKTYEFPGKNSIRTGDAKIYVSFTEPHIEILSDVPNNDALNLFHGDLFYDSSVTSGIEVKMYLRVLGSTPNYYNYKWVDIGSNVAIENDIDGDPIYITLTADPSLFASIDNKTNTYSTDNGILPSASWSDYKSWMNIGDIWLDSSNPALGTVQKVYTYDASSGTFKWSVLQGNNPPSLVPKNITTLEDTIATGNLLSSAFDLEGDSITLVSVTVGLVETYAISGSNVPVQLSDSLGTFTLIGDNGDYSFIPTPNKNTNTTFSFTYKAKDSKGAVSTSVFSIAITPVNDPPQVTGPIDILYLADEPSKTLDLLSNTTDVDLDFISVDDLTKISGDDSGIDPYQKYTRILGINPSSYINILKRDEINSIIFSYSVTDNKSAKVPTTATVKIKGINHPPVVSGNINKLILASDAVTDINLLQNATDFDGDVLHVDPLDFNATGNEIGITRVLASNKVTVTPQLYHDILKRDETLDIVYTYYVLDSVSARSNMATANITLKGVNHPPVVSSNITVNKLTTDATFDIMLDQFATDFDGDTLSIDPLDFNVTGDETGITRVLSSNKIIVKPSLYTLAAGASSVITYTYYVLDEVSARSNLSTLTITITGA